MQHRLVIGCEILYCLASKANAFICRIYFLSSFCYQLYTYKYINLTQKHRDGSEEEYKCVENSCWLHTNIKACCGSFMFVKWRWWWLLLQTCLRHPVGTPDLDSNKNTFMCCAAVVSLSTLDKNPDKEEWFFSSKASWIMICLVSYHTHEKLGTLLHTGASTETHLYTPGF